MTDVEALTRLKTYVEKKKRDLEVADPTTGALVSSLHSSVNATDTWQGPMADEEASYAQTDISAVLTPFSDLITALDTAINAEGG